MFGRSRNTRTRQSYLLVLTASICLCAHPTASAEENEWIPLFDGKTLDGWEVYHGKWTPEKSWIVEDGVLFLKRPIGFVRGTNLISTEQFDNFHLRFEWKVSKGANSGVMYLVRKGDAAPFLSGPEYQITDDANLRPNPILLAASMYDVVVAEKKQLQPTGEWNTAQIVLDNNHVEHWLNGQKVVEIDLHSDHWKERVAKSKFRDIEQFAAAPKGHIALQDHGYPVWYRNIRIRRLPQREQATPPAE